MPDADNKDRKTHWESVYGARPFTDVSWYQARPETSLAFIEASGVAVDAPVVDVGGGASTLVDCLLERGFTDLTVVDIAAAALDQARMRLGARADDIDWQVADVLEFRPPRRFALWHDRAVLHFLTAAADRDRYRQSLRHTLAPGGHLVLATFGTQGPQKCSGLPVRRYDVGMLGELLGPEFGICEDATEIHRTPGGGEQQFLYTRWIRHWCLDTERLILRRLTLDDADLMLAVWNDPAFVRNVGDRGVRTLEQARDAMQTGALQLYADFGYGPYVMVLKSTGVRIGICGLFRRENLDDPDIGFAVLPEYAGKGLAGEAAFAVLNYARDELALDALTAIVSPGNAPSIGLIEKLGMRFDRMITMPDDDTPIRLYSMNLNGT